MDQALRVILRSENPAATRSNAFNTPLFKLAFL